MRCDLHHTARPVFAGQLKIEQFSVILRTILSGDFRRRSALNTESKTIK